MNTIYFIIIIFLVLAAIAIGLGVGLTKDKSSSGDDPGPVIQKWVSAGFDAAGGFSSIMYSPDGQTWTQSGPTGDSFSHRGTAVAYGTDSTGDPLYVAVGNDSTAYGSIMYSPDGQTWTQSGPTGASFSTLGYGVAYGTSNGTNPLWVAVGPGVGFGSIIYSPDGKIWTETTTGSSFASQGSGVAYGTSNGTSPLWVAVGDNTGGAGLGNIMYSPDGKIWTGTTTGASFASHGSGVAYGTSNGTSPLWVALGVGGVGFANIMYSPDGKTWAQTTEGASFSVQGSDVAYGTSNGTSPLWVAVGTNGGGFGSIMYSPDGKIWTDSDPTGASFSVSGTAVAYGTDSTGEPFWVAVGDDLPGGTKSGNIMYSPDGKTWALTTTGASFSNYGSGVASSTKNPAL